MIRLTSAALFAGVLVGAMALGADDMRVVKVQARSDGSIVMDGRPATTDELRKVLADAHGQVAVWYYREHAEQEPTEGQLKVIAAIIDNKAPVSLSTKSDFSDFVGSDGKSHPRNPTK
jgi:hypothetical protein